MPRDWSKKSIAAAYQRSSQAGEVVSLSQKLGWISDECLRRYENDVALAQEHGLEIFISIELLEDDRKEISNLPDELRGKRFGDATLRRYYIKEVTEIARRYCHDILDLGVEINGFFQAHPEDVSSYVSLYISR
ncbi:MAG: hypothetical protein ACC628_11365 [Pirellulaceae bacterium]